MSELKNISKSLDQTLKNSDLQNVTIDLAEVCADSLMQDGIIKDVPIIGTIIGMIKSAIQIKDHLFLKKIIYFISEIKSIPTEKRCSMITKIDNSGKFKMKVGEKLIFIIDKCDDYEKSKIVATLFSAFLSERLTYKEFLTSSNIIQKIMLDDLVFFVENTWERIGIEETEQLVFSGLLCLESPEITVEDQWDYKQNDKYIVDGSKLTMCITSIGRKIREVLKRTGRTIS